MNPNYFKPIFIIPAIIVALLIVIIGFQKSKLKKNSYFLTLVFVILSFMGCSSNEQSKPQNTELVSNNKIDDEISSKLNKFDEWKELKKLWIKIDRIDQDTSKNFPGTIYSFSFIKEAQIINLRKDSILNIVNKIDNFPLDSVDLKFLNSLFNSRIQGISSGTMLLSHMMPPPALIKRNTVIFDLEQRIDKLNELKNSNILNQHEYEKTLQNICKIASNANAYQIIQESYLHYGFDFTNDLITDLKIDEIQNKFNEGHNKLCEILKSNNNIDYLKEMEKNKSIVNDEFELLKQKQPILNKIIRNLEDY